MARGVEFPLDSGKNRPSYGKNTQGRNRVLLLCGVQEYGPQKLVQRTCAELDGPANPGISFYALADGSFAVWDPARNYWNSKGQAGDSRPAAYVFSSTEVWDGLRREEDDVWLCNELIRDWASWQKEKGQAFTSLMAVLEALSPSDKEKLSPGELTRISLTDARDMPTLKMPYGQDVPVVHASSGMRRIIALAYFLVWCRGGHQKAKTLPGESPENKTVLRRYSLLMKWSPICIPNGSVRLFPR